MLHEITKKKKRKKRNNFKYMIFSVILDIYQRGFKGKQVNFIGRMASTFQVTYSKIYLKFSTAGRNFKQLNFNSFLFRKAEKTFFWIHFCQPFSPNYENILFNWCRIYFLQYLDWVHVKGTCHWVGIPTVNAVNYRPSVERLNQAPCFTSGFLVASKQYGGLCVLSNLSLCL